jgi:hypothetical protein
MEKIIISSMSESGRIFKSTVWVSKCVICGLEKRNNHKKFVACQRCYSEAIKRGLHPRGKYGKKF